MHPITLVSDQHKGKSGSDRLPEAKLLTYTLDVQQLRDILRLWYQCTQRNEIATSLSQGFYMASSPRLQILSEDMVYGKC